MAGCLEAGIHVFLDQLPDGLAIGAQDDEALDTEYSTNSALTQMSVYHCAKLSSWLVIACTSFLLSFAIFVFSSKGRAPNAFHFPCVPHEPILKAPP